MTQYINKNALIAEIKKIYNEYYKFLPSDIVENVQNFKDDVLRNIDTLEVKEAGANSESHKEDKLEIDEKFKVGVWFTGLIPCWIDAPSTLHAAHSRHGKNIVAIHLKEGGYRCCCVDDKNPSTFSLAENTPLVEGWHNRENSSNKALIQQALDKTRGLANTIEGALAGEEPYPATYYRMCQEIIKCLIKIDKIV